MTVLTGKEALAQILLAEGVECVFGIPGATEVQFLDMMAAHPEIRYILCLHELVAVGMAEGYARTSGKPGVLNLHTGTGLAAGLALLSNAREGRVPLVVTVGQQDTRLLTDEPAMSDDLVRIAGPFTKWAAEVRRPEELPTVMRRAFREAQRAPSGPVMVSLPLDVLAGTLDFAGPAASPPPPRLRPDERSVEAAAELLADAAHPVLIVQDGVARCGALEEAVRLAELIGARVYQPWMSDVAFPVHHPLYLGDLDTDSPATHDLLAPADVVVAVGALLFQQAVPTPKPLLPPSALLVQIDDDPRQIAKNYPVACALEGDIKAALTELDRALEVRLSGAGEPAASARAAVTRRTAAIAAESHAAACAFAREVAAHWADEPLSVGRLMAELRDAVPPGTRIVDDCWSASAVLRRTIPFSTLGEYQRSRHGGSIGGGLPMALGVKLAAPQSPVVCVSGDGSAAWSIQSLWNAAHDGLPVTFVVLANRCYRQVRLMKGRLLDAKAARSTLGTDLVSPELDFCALAEGFGVAARRVEKPGELRAALAEALGAGSAFLLEVVVDASL